MKFKSKIDVISILAYIIAFLIGVGILFLAYLNYTGIISGGLTILLSILCMVVGSLFVAYSIAALIKTEYVFNENHLYVHSGFFKNNVQYNRVLGIKDSKKFFTYNCLSLKKLEINYRDENGAAKIYVSPKDKEKFILEIRKYCKSCKIEVGK